MLFRELLRSVPAHDAAHAALAHAAGVVEAAVQTVNERVREVEGMGALQQLAATLGQPDLLTPSRAVVRSLEGVGWPEGSGVAAASAVSSQRAYTLHLCTDLLLLTKLRQRQFQWEERHKLVAFASLSQVTLETVGLDAGTRTLRLTLRPSTAASGAAADAGGQDGYSQFLLMLPSKEAEEALALLAQLQSRHAATVHVQDKARTLRAKRGSSAESADSAVGADSAPLEQGAKLRTERRASRVEPAASTDAALSAAVARQYAPRAEALERLAGLSHPSVEKQAPPPRPPPPTEPPKPPLTRPRSHEEVKEEARHVLGAVSELDKRVRRLSVEGSALAQHLAESSLGAAGPARQLECARAHTASNVSESSSGDLTKRTVSQASNLRHHHPRTASRAQLAQHSQRHGQRAQQHGQPERAATQSLSAAQQELARRKAEILKKHLREQAMRCKYTEREAHKNDADWDEA